MTSLERRRVNASIVFMYDIVNGIANCPNVRNDIAIGNSTRILRHTDYLKIKDKLMIKQTRAQLPQMCNYSNKVADRFKIATSRSNFISLIRSEQSQKFDLSYWQSISHILLLYVNNDIYYVIFLILVCKLMHCDIAIHWVGD